jgi:glycosyltransferase involved in cell wall biosynthesis
MKIALVGTEWTGVRYGAGGLEHLLLGWATELADRHDVFVVSFTDRTRLRAYHEPDERFLRVDIETPSQLTAAIADNSIDAAVLNNRPTWIEHVPESIVVLHNYSPAWDDTRSPIGSDAVVDAVRRARSVATVSNALAAHVASVSGRTADAVVHPFVDSVLLTEPIREERLSQVLFPSRLLKKKGIEVKRRGAMPRHEFVFTNYIAPWKEPTPEHVELRALIDETPGCVLVPAMATRREMSDAIGRAQIVAVPSIEPEGFGLASIEAQAMGTPVVASDIGGLREGVRDPAALAIAGDTDSLQHALERVASEAVDRTALRGWVAERFHPRVSAMSLERVLEHPH